jgi:hypothetical protein
MTGPVAIGVTVAGLAYGRRDGARQPGARSPGTRASWRGDALDLRAREADFHFGSHVDDVVALSIMGGDLQCRMDASTQWLYRPLMYAVAIVRY